MNSDELNFDNRGVVGEQLKYLRLLAEEYPTAAAASTEIINLEAILNLPKGTEHIISDIHGEADAFFHVLKNGSGTVRTKIQLALGDSISQEKKKQLATVIYYPEQKMELLEKQGTDMDSWYRETFHSLLAVCRVCASKYTKSKVHKALPEEFSYILEELIYERAEKDKEQYYSEIINTMIRIGSAGAFIAALCRLIQRLVVDHLHIVGDIYDRGEGAVPILDMLMNYHSVDIQWGNHDILWMGAASGNQACIANVIRICARYGNLDTLDTGYGINLLPLSNFAMQTYKEDSCRQFRIRKKDEQVTEYSALVERRMHKAIAVIQFKLEGQIILRRRDFRMENRLLLDKMNLEKGTVVIDGQEYPLLDTHFPTLDPEDPYRLSQEEEQLMEQLTAAFLHSEKLQQHAEFLFRRGSLYLCSNDILYYHGCIPLNADGSFRKVHLLTRWYSGRSLYDFLEKWARAGYHLPMDAKDKAYGQDILWFIWSNENSPVYGKEKMATFERYFVESKKAQEEKKDNYYKLIDRPEVCDDILREFGLDPQKGHIVNGHMPVRLIAGESPLKAGGKLIIIDGGFAKAYQAATGIAGYTLLYNSQGLRLVTHQPFESTEKAIHDETDILEDVQVVEHLDHRIRVRDTDNGRILAERVRDLENLLDMYRFGIIREKP